MNSSELIALLAAQIAARGLEPLSDEQIDLLEADESDDDRIGMLEDLRDRVGLDVPLAAFPCISDDERSNGR
jgi:hypothetical protein